jgi:hypothetical protein
MEVQAFRSKSIVLTIKADGSRHKIIHVMFGRDGTLYVSFPYFKHPTGILAVATMRHGVSTSDINLAGAGKVSSHLVKYSHHPDGRAHFSQDGKVKTEIKKQSVSLKSQQGHIFTVLVQGLSSFDLAQDNETGTSPKRTTLTFDVPDANPRAFRIVGRWYYVEDLHADPRPPTVGPIVVTKRSDGKMQPAFIIANPHPGTQHVLLLTCEPEKAISNDPNVLAFYGGFDPPSVVFDSAQPTSFLAFIYPAHDFQPLKASIGSIDFTRQTPLQSKG